MHTPVLIVGGGVVGLSTAAFLAHHGVKCVLVERHPDLLVHPRARGLTPRTMELYRQIGLEPAILERAYAGKDFVWRPIRADTLSGEYTDPDEPMEDDGSGSSPCTFGPIDQDKLEAILRDRATASSATLRFDTQLTAFRQDDATVTATLLDRRTGSTETITADYLVAADGWSSGVRKHLGIDVDGPGRLFTTMTAIVSADLTAATRGRAVTIAYLMQPRPFTVLMAHDDAGRRWVFSMGIDPDHEPLDAFDDERVADLVRAAAGLPEVPVTVHPQIPGTDLKILAFPIVAQIARRYRCGRVFLVGDAAHSWPPTGGLGANTGVQDAHNLAWKLAAVVSGEAGAGLLDSYETERRPIGTLTLGQAMARFGSRMGPQTGPEIIDYGAVSMGYRYPTGDDSGADRPDGGTSTVVPRELRGQPGTRAPHVVLDGAAGGPPSTLDLYGGGFVLLTGPDGRPWESAAAQLPVAVTAYALDADGAGRHGLESGGALLVRPDGFVAWRTTSTVTDPVTALHNALDVVLARHPHAARATALP
jgi:putative polyketide hydroxylase